ncbi:MAG TPA: serine hydrolase domain-containing protein [Thermoanaerobaculia bacterium]|nr:serine hydrolase domain-containing protein [Thermoanaerobaculia bacterium]
MISALLLAATLQNLDARVEQAMRDTGTPSLAVAIVKDDKVIHQRSFGAPPGQRFYLASAPKPMTALTARLLAHEKKLDLDAPLTATLPQLKLPPPLDPARISVRDLLTHRLGFENEPVVWRASYSGEWSDEQVFALLEKQTVVTPRQFSYDNLGYLLASYAAERASGEPWWTTLRLRVLAPLEMNSTGNEPCVPTKSARTMNRGSGGLCSTIGDMTRWLRVNMTDGTLDGKRVFPLSVMREVHGAQISLDRKFGRLQRFAYGLGWYLADYEGELVIHHFGSYPEAWAHISWMPDRGIGVVVLANEMTPLPDSVAMLAYDTLLGRDDAAARFDKEVASLREMLSSMPRMLESMRKKIHDESADRDRPLAGYAGAYLDDGLGTLEVRHRDGALTAAIGDRSAPLVRVRGNAFYVQWFRNQQPERITIDGDVLSWHGRTFRRKP